MLIPSFIYQAWRTNKKAENNIRIHPHVKPSRCINASFHISETRLDFPTTKGFGREISMELLYQCMAIFINFSPTSSHLHPLEVKNCDSNSRLVVDEDDNGKFRLKMVYWLEISAKTVPTWRVCRRQILTYKSRSPHWKNWNFSNGRRPIT